MYTTTKAKIFCVYQCVERGKKNLCFDFRAYRISTQKYTFLDTFLNVYYIHKKGELFFNKYKLPGTDLY